MVCFYYTPSVLNTPMVKSTSDNSIKTCGMAKALTTTQMEGVCVILYDSWCSLTFHSIGISNVAVATMVCPHALYDNFLICLTTVCLGTWSNDKRHGSGRCDYKFVHCFPCDSFVSIPCRCLTVHCLILFITLTHMHCSPVIAVCMKASGQMWVVLILLSLHTTHSHLSLCIYRTCDTAKALSRWLMDVCSMELSNWIISHVETLYILWMEESCVCVCVSFICSQ